MPYWLCFTPKDREYEAEIEALLERFADVTVRFVDAGANIGYWSIMASRRFGWPVVAIEAAQVTAAKLRRNLALNGCETVTVCENAISNADGGFVEFHFDALFHAGAHVVASGTVRIPFSVCPP